MARRWPRRVTEPGRADRPGDHRAGIAIVGPQLAGRRLLAVGAMDDAVRTVVEATRVGAWYRTLLTVAALEPDAVRLRRRGEAVGQYELTSPGVTLVDSALPDSPGKS